LVMAVVMVCGLMADAKPSDKTNSDPQAMDAAERRSIEDGEKWIEKSPMGIVERTDFLKKAKGECRSPYLEFKDKIEKVDDAQAKADDAQAKAVKRLRLLHEEAQYLKKKFAECMGIPI